MFPTNDFLVLTLALLMIISSAVFGLSQDQSADVFTALEIKQIDISNYPTINVYIEFINQDGKKVSPLPGDRIVVYEDEIKFPSTLTKEGEVYTIFLVDASGSMRGKLDNVVQAISRYVYRMNKKRGDKAAVLSFKNWEEGTKVEQDFTDDEGKLIEAAKGIEARGQTALYEAIREASTYFYPEYYSPTKTIIILTDGGGDTQSNIEWFQAVEFAKSKGIKIFCLAVGAKEKMEDLDNICKSTGGEVFYTRNPEELPIIYTKISKRVRSTRFKVTYTTDVEKPKGKPQYVQVVAYRDNKIWCKSVPVAYKMRY